MGERRVSPSLTMSTPADQTPTPPLPGQFVLKTAPLPGVATSRYTGRYLRQNSLANPAVMVMSEPPKYLRGNFANEAAQAGVKFTSWLPKHADKFWGVVLRSEGAGKAGWERVEIAEDEVEQKLRIVQQRGTESMEAIEVLDGSDIEDWTGWIVCEWSLGHPQLFWTTKALQEPLPDFCERVIIMREMLA